MSRLGVVANANSWKNRDASRAAPVPAGVLHAAPGSADGYADVLKRFAEGGVDTVAIDGGDGTLRDVVAAAVAAYGDRLPAFALVPSGKTNVAAADVGGVGRGPDALPRLLKALEDGSWRKGVATRRPIEIGFDGRKLYGFVFGLGAFERATRLVDDRVHSAGFAQKLGVALGVVTSVSAAIGGSEREVWRRGERIALGLDGAPARELDSFALLATSLHRWLLGLWPFWGHGTAPIALTEVDAPPRRLALGLATAGIGKPRPWAEAEGWRSSRVETASLTLDASFIVDGDRFTPGADGRVELKAGPALSFIRL